MKYIEMPALARLAQSLSNQSADCSVNTRIEAYSCKHVKRDKKLFKTLETAYRDELSNSPPPPSWIDDEQDTPFGPFDKHASRKMLYLLIATLNVAFPDHDFSDVKPAHFNKEQNAASLLGALSSALVAPHSHITAPRGFSSYPPTSVDNNSPSSSPLNSTILPGPTHPSVYRTLDSAIGLADSEVFSYTPELRADPHVIDLEDDEFELYEDKDVTSPIPIPFPRESHERATYAASSGALLWSSHWFLVNKKQKRILFVTMCARSRGITRHYFDQLDEEDWIQEFSDMESDSDFEFGSPSERFSGWEGGIGAGARALGLPTW